LINSVANTGGFAGPYLLGAISGATHSFNAALYAIAAASVAGGVLSLRAGGERRPEATSSSGEARRGVRRGPTASAG
jgi:cyanate permease